jgi:NAD dependent epimerase/dehydratase
MNWHGQKVLVTGAGGFIGSHLCETLVREGAEVTAFIHYNSRGGWGNLEFLPDEVKRSIKVIPGFIEDPDCVDRAVSGQGTLFHLAALIGIPYSYQAARSYVRTNVEGTLNILEAARRHGVERVVHTSTSETYGTALYVPIDEKHPLQAQSPYAATKIAGDKLAESYYCSFGLPVATVRPFNTYGPRQSARAVIPTIIIQALESEVVHLGSLDPERDLLYVGDTVEGFLRVAQSPACAGEVVNLGTGEAITIGDLARKILSLMEVGKEIVTGTERVRPERSEVQRLLCNNTKALELAGWAPKHSLEEGLWRTIEWISAHLSLYRADFYSV